MISTKTLLYKFITTFIAAYIAFAFIDQNQIIFILIVALAASILKYVLKDLFIFPTMGNVFASIIDGVFASVTVYLFDILSTNFSTSSTGLIIFAFLIAVAEYFYHIYLWNNEKVSENVFHKEQEPPIK